MAKNPALRAVSGGSAKAANRGEPFSGGKSARFTTLTIRSASDEAHKCSKPMARGSKTQAAIWRRFGPKCLLPATRKTCSTQRSRCEPPAGYKSLTEAHKMPLKPLSRFPNC